MTSLRISYLASARQSAIAGLRSLYGSEDQFASRAYYFIRILGSLASNLLLLVRRSCPGWDL